MSTEQVDGHKQLPIEVEDWNGLYKYVNKSLYIYIYNIIIIDFRLNFYLKVLMKKSKYV